MRSYNEVTGDLIKLGLEGKFDVVAHGCNCFCRMKRGIAPQMAEAFGADLLPMERMSCVGDINKLGQIDFKEAYIWINVNKYESYRKFNPNLTVVNCYTQYHWSTETKPFDYEAFTLCMRKLNHTFKNRTIGMPKIGSHLAGGDWERIKEIIQKELVDCNVTIVIFG